MQCFAVLSQYCEAHQELGAVDRPATYPTWKPKRQQEVPRWFKQPRHRLRVCKQLASFGGIRRSLEGFKACTLPAAGLPNGGEAAGHSRRTFRRPEQLQLRHQAFRQTRTDVCPAGLCRVVWARHWLPGHWAQPDHGRRPPACCSACAMTFEANLG